jgi:hypothetical protein
MKTESDDSSLDINSIEYKLYEEANDWTEEHEHIFVEWSDKSMIYRWLHSRANVMYSNLNAWYTIPVIIISTLTGTANFAQEKVPYEYQSYFGMIIGTFNIVAGIVTTIQQFLKITQLNEAHRVSGIAWDKFYRNIKIELAKHPSERMQVLQMLKICKEEFDRLMETSPVIPDTIIAQFKESFQDLDIYQQLAKPEICDVLVSTNETRNSWFSEDYKEKKLQELIKFHKIKHNKQKKNDKDNHKIISDFKSSFYELHNRDPLYTEIMDNLSNQIPSTTLMKLLGDKETV